MRPFFHCKKINITVHDPRNSDAVYGKIDVMIGMMVIPHANLEPTQSSGVSADGVAELP